MYTSWVELDGNIPVVVHLARSTNAGASNRCREGACDGLSKRYERVCTSGRHIVNASQLAAHHPMHVEQARRHARTGRSALTWATPLHVHPALAPIIKKQSPSRRAGPPGSDVLASPV